MHVNRLRNPIYKLDPFFMKLNSHIIIKKISWKNLLFKLNID
jgi:hypothetical protein